MDKEREAKLNSKFMRLNDDVPVQSSVRCYTCGLMVPTTMRNCPQDGTDIAPAILGDALWANYEFIEAVGAGGMSVIYKARHRALNRLVAIKMLHGHMLTDTVIRRFQQEAKASSLLRHPNTVAVYDFGVTESGQPFMVMDYIDGETLANRLRRTGTLAWQDCVKICKQVCDAVEHAHDLGILHRDLKPGNIMLIEAEGTPGIVKILDFGIAKIMDATDSPGHNLTQTGDVFGSPFYMSPEQCSGIKELDRRSDVYSLGCVMYECLTGTVPHRGETVMSTIVKQINELPTPISEMMPEAKIPAALEDIVDKALKKNPEKRFQSMEELREALVELRDNKSVDTTGGAKIWKRLSRKIRISQKSVVALTIVSCVAITAVSLTLLSTRTQQQKPTSSAAQSTKFPADSITSLRDKYETFRSYADRTKITDSLLAEFLPNDIQIEKLDLRATKLTDRGMLLVGKQSRLKDLSIANTAIDDAGVTCLKNLNQIQTLDLHSTHVTNDGLKTLAGLTNIRDLNLAHTDITNSGLANLQGLHKLTRLYLTSTPISGEGLLQIKALPIERLHIDDTIIKDSEFNTVNQFTHLVELHIGASKLTGSGFESLKDLKSLKQLFMSNGMFEDKYLRFLKQLPQLEEVGANKTAITDAGLAVLAEIPTLKTVQFNNDKITNAGMKYLLQMPQLERLSIERTAVNDEGLQNIDQLKNLRELDVAGCPITDASLPNIGRLPNLRRLNIKNCTQISIDLYEEFRNEHPNCHIDR